MSFNVELLDNKLNDLMFNKIQKGDTTELVHWYNAIDAELQALHENIVLTW